MSIVTLERAKAHVYVTHDDDDELIQHYLDAAEDYAAKFMGRDSLDDLAEIDSDQPSEGGKLPASVEQAVLLLMGDFYALREAQVTGTILAQNPAAEALMHFYRVGLGV